MSSSDLSAALPIIERVQEVLHQYSGLLRGVYRLYAGGGSQWKSMSSSQFLRLLKDCRVMGKGRTGNVKGTIAHELSGSRADVIFAISNRPLGVAASLESIRAHVEQSIV